MGDKTKEQLLEELIQVQKILEERTEMQGQMIRKFQLLISNEGLFSQIIDFFPYPIAIFTQQYTLAVVNKAFAMEAKTPVNNPEAGAVRILQYKIDDTRLAAAVTKVFAGDTFFLEDLKSPFSMFSGITGQRAQQSVHYKKAVIFPVSADDVEISHGVIVFMP
jgi:AraC family transcriptional regulator